MQWWVSALPVIGQAIQLSEEIRERREIGRFTDRTIEDCDQKLGLMSKRTDGLIGSIFQAVVSVGLAKWLQWSLFGICGMAVGVGYFAVNCYLQRRNVEQRRETENKLLAHFQALVTKKYEEPAQRYSDESYFPSPEKLTEDINAVSDCEDEFAIAENRLGKTSVPLILFLACRQQAECMRFYMRDLEDVQNGKQLKKDDGDPNSSCWTAPELLEEIHRLATNLGSAVKEFKEHVFGTPASQAFRIGS